MKKYIKDPKSVEPGAKMKAYPSIADKDLDDLVAYLLTLKAEPKK
jgi:cytochrome c1